MSADFERMMGWLSNEVVQGLSFNAGSTFDPPYELRAWRVQPDISLGVGSMPLNKGKFPFIETPALKEKKPENLLPNSVSFPNLALHFRVGLPNRFDVTFRGANMTVPKGYKLAPGTEGNGQSNSMGIGIRRHFLGGRELPLLSVSANVNHVKGYFNFLNAWQRLELTPGFSVDSRNVGRLEWNVNSVGLNAVVSKTYGIWTPFMGLGWNRMSGSMKARLQADFATPLISPAVGEASDHPEENQARVIVGTQLDRSRFSLFLNGEIKAIGIQSGKAFIVQMGAAFPFRIGASAYAARGNDRLLAGDSRDKESWELDEGERIFLHNAPRNIELPKRRKRRSAEPEAALDPVYRPAKWDYRETRKADKKRRRRDELPEMIFIQ